MSKSFPSAVIMKGNRSKKNKFEKAGSPLDETVESIDHEEMESMEEVPKTKLKGIDSVPPKKLEGIKTPKAEDVMSIDLMLNAAKKKKPEAEIEMGPTEVEGKSFGYKGSEKYLKAIKKYKRG